MAANPIQVLSKYTEAYGDTFRFYLGGIKEAIVTTDPAVIQHVLKTNAENYEKSDIQVKRMGHFLGKGLLTTHGEAWRTQRRLIQKGFDRRQLDALSTIMQDSLTESLREFDSQVQAGPVDIYPHLMKMTFAMVAPFALWRQAQGRRHRPRQPHHLHRAGIHRSPNPSALPESMVCRLRRTAQARRDARPRRRHSDANTSSSAAMKSPATTCCRP